MLAVLATACTNKLALEIELVAPVRPDPFTDVATVRMRALVLGEVTVLGEDRWDQGPIELPLIVDPEVERFVVEGLSRDGRVLSSGASLPLDLFSEPPDGRVQILFTRIGELSSLSESTGARFGARAVELDDQVLIAGGTDENGRPIETTELLSATGVRAGPLLSGGRTGELAALVLPDGRVAIAGGDGGDRRLAVLDPSTGSTRFSEREIGELRRGAAYAAVSDSLLIVAGGEGVGQSSNVLLRFNPKTLEPSTPGTLVDGRADSTAVVVSAGRVLMLGGTSSAAAASAKRDALVFDPARGAAALRSIDLGGSWIAPIARVTAAGSAILAGGRDRDGAPLSRLNAVFAQPDRAQAFGDTSTVAALLAPVGEGELLDLEDGSLLLLPRNQADSIQYIELAPPSVRFVPALAEIAGPYLGGRTGDGTVRLRSPAGELLVFNPGVASVLGVFDPDLSIIPLRPAAWTYEGGAIEGRLLPGLPQGGLLPAELAVLGSTELLDFELTFSIQLSPLSQAAIAFSLSSGDYDHVSFLGNIALAGRFQRDTQVSLSCASAETPPLSDGRPHQIRIARRKTELRVEVDGDDFDDLVCQTPAPRAGRIALGVIAGTAKYTDLKIRTVF